MKTNTNTQNLYLQGLSVQDLKEFLTDLFETKLNSTGNLLPNNVSQKGNKISFRGEIPEDGEPTFITRGQVAKMLQISLPTLHNYVKQGLIKSYRIGGKVRFKANEIEKSLTERNFTSVNRKGGRNHA